MKPGNCTDNIFRGRYYDDVCELNDNSIYFAGVVIRGENFYWYQLVGGILIIIGIWEIIITEN